MALLFCPRYLTSRSLIISVVLFIIVVVNQSPNESLDDTFVHESDETLLVVGARRRYVTSAVDL